LSSLPPTGGDGVYTYQWEKAEGTDPWAIIPGATSTTYLETSPLTATTRYRLEQSSGSGCGVEYTNDVIVTVTDPIWSEVVPNMDTVCINENIDFLGFSGGFMNPTSWDWSFGDGTTDTGTTPPAKIHSYGNAGNYEVILTVTDTVVGCEAIDTVIIHVVNPPQVDFNYNVVECQTIHFEDQSTAPTGYSIVDYHWDLDDGGAIGVDPTFDYTYTVGGIKSVTLTIIAEHQNGSTCTNYVTKPVIVPLSPTAYFTWDPDPAQADQEIEFTGASGSGFVITDWVWNFGDGNGDLGQIVYHTYNNPGTPTYDVMLTVTDDNQCVTEITQQVLVGGVPPVDFTWDEGCKDSDTYFYVDETITNIAEVASYEWNCGDGQYEYGFNPSHIYGTSGTYDVTLTIVDIYGFTNNVTHQIEVHPLPVSLFSIDGPNCEGGETWVSDYSTTNSGYIETWEWDFGDGSPIVTITRPNDPNISHTYASTGLYTITLTVTTNEGCIHSSTNEVSIIPSPIAMFSVSSTCLSGPISFVDESNNNGGGQIVSWSWDFGDPASGTQNTSSLQNPVHQYTGTGNYDVLLIISNSEGCIDTSDVYTINIPDAPTVDFTWTQACVGSEVEFTNDYSGDATYSWNFGDGGTSTLPNPTHPYNAAGDYEVTLVIVTNEGCVAMASNTVSINPLPNANFEHTSPGCLNDTIYFTDLSISPNGTIAEWHWDFGDGTEVTITAPDDPDVSHQYTNNTTYAVTLTVTDSEGCENSVVKNVEIVSSPIADFTYAETCYEEPVYFTDLSSTNTGPDIQSWEWYFGDPASGTQNNSSLQNPTHIYTEPATYTVTLIIANTVGCSDTIEQELTVEPLPEVSIDIQDDSICLGELAIFTGISNDDISTWFWDFGDGGSNVGQNQEYMYTAPGMYIVTLTVTEIGESSCQNIATDTIYVNDAPEPAFEYENTCLGDTTYFTDLSYSQLGFITEWLWDFGDGNTSTEEDPAHYYQSSGEYQVTLTSTDNYGCSNSIEQWIQIFTVPMPEFSYNQVCDPIGQVFFSDESEPGADGSPIVGWNWQLEDGNYSTDISPSYIYSITDTCYTVILEVTDGNGCTATDTNTQVCLFGELDIDFSSTEECLGKSTFFEASYLPESDSVSSYTWNFNDGTPNEITYHDTISHIFPNPATYIVELTALDTNGCSITVYHEVIVDSLPTPQFSNTVGNCNEPTQFTDESLGGGEFIDSWYWDFGDISSGGANTSTLQHPTHQYGPYDSTYQVKLIVTNFNGCIDSIVQDVYVEPCLVADFDLPIEPLCARYDNLCFVDQSQLTSNNGTITQWRWDFGDGETYNYGTQQDSICHTYAQGGSYEVELIVEATINGIIYSDTVTKQLTVHATPEASIQVENNCYGDSTEYYDSSNANLEPITMWHWDFGDDTNPDDTSVLQNPLYLYPAYGTYNTELKVENQYGCRDSIIVPVTIYKPPVAAFSFEETCMSYYTYFINESEGDSSDIEQYSWNFGDTLTMADTSSLQDPNYVYDSLGYYTILLEVTDGNQCSDTISHEIEIYPIPSSSFTIVDTIQQGQIYLDNTSTGGIEYYWDFDYDNALETSEDKNPTHQYEEDGNYNIMLVSYNEYNCPDTTYEVYDLLFTNLFVPNAFIPSSSNPELKIFKPTGINIKRYHIEVYSAWGNLVFESSQLEDGTPAEGWDGTYKEEALPTGSYVWRITAVFEDDTQWKGSDNGDGNSDTNGTVTLIR